MFFVWDDRNIAHIGEHDVEPYEAEWVVRNAKRPYPRKTSAVKYLVKGPTIGGRWLQVIYVYRPASTVDIAMLSAMERLELLDGKSAAYIIHARDLRPRER
jgi:hypothetical protein